MVFLRFILKFESPINLIYTPLVFVLFFSWGNNLKHPTRMKFFLLIFLTLTVIFGCETKKKQPEPFKMKRRSVEASSPKKMDNKNAELMVDMTNLGIGPIKNFDLSPIDPMKVKKGKKLFEVNCTTCHKVEKKFIGPSLKGILDRRSPEWVLNMILNPEEMIKKDPIAKQLLLQFNGAPMANQNITQDEAIALLDYLRTF